MGFMIRGESWRGAGVGTCRLKALETLAISFSGAYLSKVVIRTDITK